ncbi:MAG: GGDEF domain-containing protein [Oscillospiraceae bacterium]|nr:GGDEF domain-containing protein [Oscillospiraceae bacterium]
MDQNIDQAGLPGQAPEAARPAAGGETAEFLKEMARKLKEREAQLQREIRRARRRAEIIESYTEMLVELLDQRDEWLLVVDEETRQVVHCNKRTPGGGEDGAYCVRCLHRLPIQPRLLEWNGAERYQVWELEEGERGSCYRIISFPIEWKERPSCVHIVMDITVEKMNARHLKDEIYQDMDTGIRSHQFLDEFMGRVLRERQDITLCYLDLEGVADINTSYGRAVGDAYIQNFVEIVRKNFRSGDTFARIKDDKFCLMLTGNVKHLIERKMTEILTAFQRDDDRVFSHHCNFKYSILEVEGESNLLSLDKLLAEAEADIRRQKRKKPRKQRKQSRAFDFDEW